ncbi:MAG: VanZ family protein [Acetobacter sp.]|nr:VanZ family protein [Bacteroides sp.]MCM1341484.1 VanZ family protein [Acetobacter sp.]MCM1434177.1 VanZ family protein [Clostridiales bacterium]
MQQEKNKTKLYTAVSWSLTVICMAVIFWLSSRTSAESSEQSGVILEWLITHFGDGVFTDFIVRKSAHCLEYTGLALLMNISLYFSKNKLSPLPAIALTSAYAVTDEIHQLFVEGRSCQPADWAIDTLGAAVGTATFLLIWLIINAYTKKRIDSKNN